MLLKLDIRYGWRKWLARTFFFARQIRSTVREHQTLEMDLAAVRSRLWNRISQSEAYRDRFSLDFPLLDAEDASTLCKPTPYEARNRNN
jgi:CYTH domain-containing protein